MFNLNTREHNPPEHKALTETLGVDVYALNCLAGTIHSHYGNGNRCDNAGLLDFSLKITDFGGGFKLHTTPRRNKARNATSEFSFGGHNLGIHCGLNIILLKVTSETREQSQYSSGGGHNEIPGPNFTGKIRPDFPPIEQYYLIAFDPDECHLVRTGTGHAWYVQCDTTIKAGKKVSSDESINIRFCSSSGKIYGMTSKLSGMDYLMAARVCNMTNSDEGPSVGEGPAITNWVSWSLNNCLDELSASQEEKENVKAKTWIAPVVKYSEQFKDAENIYHVGHLRFVRVADGMVGNNSSHVLDHVQWYGIIPILNVEKSMDVTLDNHYFNYYTDNGCKVCNQVSLELPPGRYAIDVNKTCFYYDKSYKYPHGKKAWILSMLANSQVVIEKNITDRIMPVGEIQSMANIAYNDDDDFLNRI